jgi:hypothetical protein
VPLPYWLIADGHVPVVRFAMLGLVAAAYSAIIDGSGVGWMLTLILLGHVLVFSVLLAAAAAAVVWLVPASRRAQAVGGLIVVGVLIAVVFDVYTTPFDEAWLRTNWTGLFQ